VIYFLDADRIAREVTIQNIIIIKLMSQRSRMALEELTKYSHDSLISVSLTSGCRRAF
jgi:hypothetical protein